MRVVKHEERQPLARIDYDKIADNYNRLEVGGAVIIDKVYNITLFKQHLERRGLSSNTDFYAFNKGDETCIKRLSQACMTKG